MNVGVRLLLFLFCGVLFAGCTTRARRLEVSAVRTIIPGTTTIAEVKKAFGPPNETVVGSNQRSVARYFFRELYLSNDASSYERREHPGDILFRTLTLGYGPDSVIREKLHDESLMPIYRHNAWNVAGPTVMPENLIFIRKGETAKAELVDRLGEPTSRSFDTDGTGLLIWLSLKARWEGPNNSEVHRLVVSLDERQRVKDFVVVTHDFPSVSGRFRW